MVPYTLMSRPPDPTRPLGYARANLMMRYILMSRPLVRARPPDRTRPFTARACQLDGAITAEENKVEEISQVFGFRNLAKPAKPIRSGFGGFETSETAKPCHFRFWGFGGFAGFAGGRKTKKLKNVFQKLSFSVLEVLPPPSGHNSIT